MNKTFNAVDYNLCSFYNLKFVLLLILTCKLTVNAQSIEEVYLNKLYQYSDKNNDSILFYVKKLKTSKDSCNKFKAYNYEAKAYYQMNKFDKAESISKVVLKELKNQNDNCLIIEQIAAYNRLFWQYKKQRYYNKAYTMAIESKELIETLPNNTLYNVQLLSVNRNLAIIKMITGFHQEGRKLLHKNYEKLPEIFQSLKVNNYNNLTDDEAKYVRILNETSTLNLIGESFLNASDSPKSVELDSASYFFKEAYKSAQKFNPPHENSETLYQLREAEVLIAKQDYKNALNLIYKYSKKSKKFNTEHRINGLKAICYNNLNKSDSSFFYAKKFLKTYNKQKGNKEKLIAIYDILSNQYFKKKQYDSAYKYSELTIAELNDFNKNKSLVNKAHYLHNENNIKTLNKNILQKESKKQLVVIGLLIFSISLSIWLIYHFKKKNLDIEQELIETKSKVSIKPEKKDYNIDEEVEQNILAGISKFEEKKGYLNQDFTINNLAKELDTNTTYLSYIFNKNYNKSFKQYITSLRIEYVVQELKTNPTLRNYTIQAIADEIGYSNASAFTRAFKKHQGVTPSEYIKSLT